ncbi:DEAD/DEAH box helicase [Plantactinospora siamensis]|uniref:DEAD/DEAH box helicase n=1 Tax=Plantactinospora siamensis TaxID=555372 RepID=A0ABV6NQ87_9ACTN
MTELLPTFQAARIQQALVDYLTTTFGLTDGDARDGLDRFLSDPDTGMFKGPYVRLRLPFRPADEGWRSSLEWYEGFPPYGHQAAAFARLASAVDGQPRRPLPTLVTTGTGSGKTEAFLHPILDHVLWARRTGVTGTKALILYPMNALANDQAARLTKLLTTQPELAGVTAALYTGQATTTRMTVTSDGLINDRAVIRDTAPDLLLTNYKMLDQLLLRAEDQELWRQSAISLRYLVLDEFHTYDGAQGTDVAMLLRRLGLALKSHWPVDDPSIDETARARPLGLMTPVATSATLGDRGDLSVMREFAGTVFGERFDSTSVVTETRISLPEWTEGAAETVAASGFAPVAVGELRAAGLRRLPQVGLDASGAEAAYAVLGLLYGVTADKLADATPELLSALCRAHPLLVDLARTAGQAVALSDLALRVFGPQDEPEPAEALLSQVLAMLGHVRKVVGRDALSVEAHLWVRELTRIDRAAAASARFRWSDDGPSVSADEAEEARPSFPAIFCRHCGRSGWGIGLAPVGDSLTADDEGIRRQHAAREGRFRPLLYAPAEAVAGSDGESAPDGLVWFAIRNRELLRQVADDDPDLRDGWVLPVLTNVGATADDLSRKDTCPSCGQEDGIRFLGSAIATLLSVSLSTLFGAPKLAPEEKKALVFTDSVQDAAHRAGFVQARSHTLTLRSVLHEAVVEGDLTLDRLVEEVLAQAGDDPVRRYRLLAPDCADRESFIPFWQERRQRGVKPSVQSRVRTRLALDAALEFGVLEEYGLLPNYTLLDDSVTLDVGLSWIDPDDRKYRYDSAQFQRGSAQALREFAPGATFYARGWEIEIDAVDLGLDGTSIRTWAFCPACGHSCDIAATGRDAVPTTCPRCGSRGIHDTGQRLDVVELTRVSAEVRRDEVAISDRYDERGRVGFQIVTAADVSPEDMDVRRFAEGTGLGWVHLRSVDIRWLNLGPAGHGTTRTIAGAERQGTLFRVCSGCGKRDTETGRNRPHEHRPWCPHRTAPHEMTSTVALSRTLRTQGLLIRLPRTVSLGDDFAVPSLSAALLLGLREQLGGHPDHIRVEQVVDPTLSDGSDNHDAILLHDTVPGGTGYLAGIAKPDQLRELLVLAWDRLRDCACRLEERLACHRCLLPFTAPGVTRRISRASAERHLRNLLGLPADAQTAEDTTWTVTEVAPHEEPESHLERSFYRVFLGRLRRSGAAVTETPSPVGNIARFTLPGTHRQWTLSPQVNVADSRPDYLLKTGDMNVPDIAIFTDGRAYHATSAVNRLADDAAKRANLRELGILVLALTSADVAAAETATNVAPPWWNAALAGGLMNVPGFQAPPETYKALGQGMVDWLVGWVQGPNPPAVRAAARAVPMFLSAGAQPIQTSTAVTLPQVGRAVLLGEDVPAGERRVHLRRFGSLAAVVEMTAAGVVEVAVVLDDRSDMLGDKHAESWRAWLRLANALGPRDWPTTATTTSLVEPLVAEPDAADPRRPIGAWADLYEAAFSEAEKKLIAALADYDITPPTVGAEGPDGIPLDICWPTMRIAVAFPDMAPEDRTDLGRHGWHLVEPEPAEIVSALTRAAADTDEGH